MKRASSIEQVAFVLTVPWRLRNLSTDLLGPSSFSLLRRLAPAPLSASTADKTVLFIPLVLL
jgi:hypothetical protein